MPRILLVDDDPALRMFVEATLKREGHEVHSLPDADDILEQLDALSPDLLILDLMLPNISGYDVLKNIRKASRFDTVPIVLFSGQNDTASKIKGLDLGAVDYLVKPIPPEELAARVRALIRQKKRQDELMAEYNRLSELSLTDPLTGAYNRRALNTFLRSRLAEATRHNTPFSCVMFDLDHFKEVNDTHGHDTGDLVLREVAALTIALFRQEDALVRYGGEEFLGILQHTSKEGARTFSERLRSEVAGRTFNEDKHPLQITLSAGVSSFPEDGGFEDPREMITLADRRLYVAKGSGRNRVVFEG
ncbi:MAG: diguanylate cyclase [Candidatus Latescibacteria bacterium]|jgi:two-component system, cell cycle response regulator|nr:diguanylate cyclase [Candidatus Latescibacterota bacterium]MBT5832703.1 diguanylate cyclase [Candidatus Latescibacterota bacterium]